MVENASMCSKEIGVDYKQSVITNKIRYAGGIVDRIEEGQLEASK